MAYSLNGVTAVPPKAVIYVIKDDRLLVFTHDGLPLARTGVPAPAGIVKLGETLEATARRELHEETGLLAMSEQYVIIPGRMCTATRPKAAGARAKVTLRMEARLLLRHAGGFRWKMPTSSVQDWAL